MTSGDGFVCQYWGKARPVAAGPSWHPLAFHCLEVAAVMSAMLEIRPAWAHSIARQSGLTVDEARKRLILVAALHDLGKFAENFQAKVPELFARLQPGADLRFTQNRRGHGDVGHRFWSELCEDREDVTLDVIEPWLLAAVAHHGAPTDGELVLGEAMSLTSRAAAVSFMDTIIGLIGRPTNLRCQAKSETWRVAGLVMLADWIGSNQRWFPYCEPSEDLAAFWGRARSKATRAVFEADLGEAAAAASFELANLLGPSNLASPLQIWAANQAIPNEQCLYLIEDLTGSGKTEAALILAHRLIAAGRAEGVYWALPTMATANGLYRRLDGRYQALFSADGAKPSLILAHGGRDLNRSFQASIGEGFSAGYGYGLGEQDQAGEAHCAAFFAEDRKKTFLAQVGVGTLDQALLSVLPVRHQALRLATLSRRVLVIDEAHAYDPYMTAALERLLGFQAALGGSAIVLSATLSARQRRKFSAAYNVEAPGGVTATAFPLVTRVTGSSVVEVPVEAYRGTRRDLVTRRQPSAEAAMTVLLEAAAQGRCGVYIRNSVKDAIEAVTWLKARAGDAVNVTLFHARFALCDRLTRENDALTRFGSTSQPADRRGQILVATQVVEQSLDLDFDHMATDLCPMDLLIQRAGRLHRHGHRQPRPEPIMEVVAPVATEAVSANWYAEMFPTGRYVYPDVGQLWRTQKLLQDYGGLPLASRSPRDLIEPVFGDDPISIPDVLIPASDAAQGKGQAARAIGLQNALKVEDFSRGAGAWDSDIRTPTRLGEPSVSVRLARWQGGILSPWCDEVDHYRAWRMSEITLRASQFQSAVMPSDDCAAAVEAAQTSWSGRFDPPPVLALTSEDTLGDWEGAIMGVRERVQKVKYNTADGLILCA